MASSSPTPFLEIAQQLPFFTERQLSVKRMYTPSSLVPSNQRETGIIMAMYFSPSCREVFRMVWVWL